MASVYDTAADGRAHCDRLHDDVGLRELQRQFGLGLIDFNASAAYWVGFRARLDELGRSAAGAGARPQAGGDPFAGLT